MVAAILHDIDIEHFEPAVLFLDHSITRDKGPGVHTKDDHRLIGG
jgi:hypothetical protein